MPFNVFHGQGRIATSLELKQTKKGTDIVNFRLAINSRKFEDKTSFLNVTAFGATASNLVKYQKKGSLIIVTGELSSNRYTNPDNKDRDLDYVSIVVDAIEYLPKSYNSGKSNDAPDVNDILDASTTESSKEEAVDDKVDPIKDNDLPF